MVAAILAGCGGPIEQSDNPFATPQSQQLPSATVYGPEGCAHGKVRVRPCKLKFTAKHQGPDTVGVRYTATKDGTLSEGDTCGGPSGVAYLEPAVDRDGVGSTQPSAGQGWYVYAGADAGSCIATFKYKNSDGDTLAHAKLKITNTL
jgi:hypothetical protein